MAEMFSSDTHIFGKNKPRKKKGGQSVTGNLFKKKGNKARSLF